MMERYKGKFDYLISEGYDAEKINQYFYVNEIVINNIVDNIYDKIIKTKIKEFEPKCLIVGGQPGSGKSCFCSDFIVDNPNYVYVNMDSFRVLHPNYDEIREMILDKWRGNDGDSENSPSNDFSTITHYFIVRVNELLVDRLSKNKYNILLEWNLRYPEGPLEFIEKLNTLGYITDIVVIIVSKYTSYEACMLRYEIMKNKDLLARRVPKSFHDLCVQGLIESMSVIEKVGDREKKIIHYICCILRDGTIIWESGMEDISLVISKYLNSKSDSVSNDFRYVEKMYYQENSRK